MFVGVCLPHAFLSFNVSISSGVGCFLGATAPDLDFEVAFEAEDEVKPGGFVMSDFGFVAGGPEVMSSSHCGCGSERVTAIAVFGRGMWRSCCSHPGEGGMVAAGIMPASGVPVDLQTPSRLRPALLHHPRVRHKLAAIGPRIPLGDRMQYHDEILSTISLSPSPRRSFEVTTFPSGRRAAIYLATKPRIFRQTTSSHIGCFGIEGT